MVVGDHDLVLWDVVALCGTSGPYRIVSMNLLIVYHSKSDGTIELF